MSLHINTKNQDFSIAQDLAGSDQPITITDAAGLKIHELIAEEDDPTLKLRISIIGGGCSGFQYQFSFDNVVNEDDAVITKTVEKINVALLVDMLSFPYLEGATVDYKNDANGERFVINNPNAKSTCGCGSSFDV